MQKTFTDVGIGATAATIPLWATQSQEWFIWIAAVAGGILAILRLGVFVWEQIQRCKIKRQIRRGIYPHRRMEDRDG